MPRRAKRRTQPARPLESTAVGHVLARAAQAIGYDFEDLPGFIRRAQHIEFGLAAEDEFNAVAAWLGRCRMAHKLEQPGVVSPALLPGPRIPDVLLLLEDGDTSCALLVEVKTSSDLTLRLTDKYLSQLTDYSKRIGLPLVIAWRPRPAGMWLLLDPQCVPRDTKGFVSLEDAMKHNLMSCVLGDYVVVPATGAGMSVKARFVGERSPTADGFSQDAVIEDTWWHDKNGARLALPAEGITASLMATAGWSQEATDEHLVQTFASTGEMRYAQQILRFVIGFGCASGERIHWRNVADDLDGVMASAGLHKDVETGFGSTMRYIFHQVPAIVPAWVPKKWRAAMWTPREPADGVATLGDSVAERP